MRAYTANMIPGGTTPTINVSQYDNNYAVTVTLIEGAETYTPPVGATIRVEGTKPDGHGFEYPCTYQGNVVTMPIHTQMTVVSGRFPIELVVYQSGLRVGSCNIIFAVERAPLGEDVDTSETVIPDIIAGAQAQADAAAASATSAAESATSAGTAKDAAMDAAEDAIEAAQELETAIQFNSALIKETVSGDIAIFADGSDNIPVQSLIAEITPVQSGTGDPSPSNVRAISGRTGLTVTRAGKNLLEVIRETRTTNGITFTVNKDTAGNVLSVVANGTATANAYFDFNVSGSTPQAVPLVDGESYIFSGLPANGSTTTYCFRIGNSVGSTLQNITATDGEQITKTAEMVLFGIIVASGYTANNLTLMPMIRKAGTGDGTFEPYIGQTYPITWQTQAGTVYGGTLDVVSGVLTVTHGAVQIKDKTWTYDATYTRFGALFTAEGIAIEATRRQLILCDAFASFTDGGGISSVPNNAIYNGGTDGRLYVKTDTATTAANFVSTYGDYHVVFPLATPLAPIQLSPTEVRTLLGNNNIYTDAGEVTVEYVADTKLYIDNKIAELQALVLEN